MKRITSLCHLFIALFIMASCESDKVEFDSIEIFDEVLTVFPSINPSDMPNYADQDIPDYIREDNTGSNDITDEGALLGRVLFYDKNLSSDNTVSCSSCHKQSLAFGDDEIASTGVYGTTGRHAMRLINSRFAEESRFFWDERASSLEDQTTRPIRDHVEMGFSGEDGDPDFDSLINKLNGLGYYEELFTYAYGDAEINEDRMQRAMAQFIRSITSFDSKYDEGRAAVNNENDAFPNFSNLENQGKQLYMRRPDFNAQGIRIGGGLGCGGCHRAPEFAIDQDSRNNGIVGSFDPNVLDIEVTRAPTLRDLFGPDGSPNGPFMHNGFSDDFDDVLDHYNEISLDQHNDNLDRRLRPRGSGQNLQMTEGEREAITAFIKTLSGNNVYTDERWSDPF